MESSPEGATIHLDKDGLRTSITALKDFGWNIAGWKARFKGRPAYLQQEQTTWQQAGGVWYVASIEETHGHFRSVVRFDDFKANVDVSPQLFRLAALELRVGARILDHRADAREQAYRYQAIPDDGSRRFFDMEAELESLPVR
jgi:hypothetical protein